MQLNASSPITRTALGVDDCDDLDFARKLAENNEEWMPI